MQYERFMLETTAVLRSCVTMGMVQWAYDHTVLQFEDKESSSFIYGKKENNRNMSDEVYVVSGGNMSLSGSDDADGVVSGSHHRFHHRFPFG